MSDSLSPTCCRVSPTKVWSSLAADHQVRVIDLMAQLAFNLVAAQSSPPIQESIYGVPAHATQNPV